MRAEIMLFAKDVELTSKWYQDFLGLQGGHGGPEYEMLKDGDELLLQLHHADADHDHGVSGGGVAGSGVIVFIHVDDVDAVHDKAVELGLEVVQAPHDNELAGMREFTLRDLNGYTLTICKSRWG